MTKKIHNLAAIALCAIACAQEPQPVPSNIDADQAIIREQVLAAFKASDAYHIGLESVEIVLVSRADLPTYCKNKDLNNGCATPQNAFIVNDPMVDYTYMLIHEYYHIALELLTGDSDAGHESDAFPEGVIKIFNQVKAAK